MPRKVEKPRRLRTRTEVSGGYRPPAPAATLVGGPASASLQLSHRPIKGLIRTQLLYQHKCERICSDQARHAWPDRTNSLGARLPNELWGRSAL